MNNNKIPNGRVDWYLAAPDGSLLKAPAFDNGLTRNRGLPIVTGFLNYDQVNSAKESKSSLPMAYPKVVEGYVNPNFNGGKPIGPFPSDLPYIHPYAPWKKISSHEKYV